jgi:hypothetical protein
VAGTAAPAPPRARPPERGPATAGSADTTPGNPARNFGERLAEVRAWVSATPAPGELAGTGYALTQLDELLPPAHPVAASRAPAERVRADRDTPPRADGVDAGRLEAPAEVHHYTLSIGTLHLALEDVPRPAPPGAAAPAPAALPALSEAARLRRHYLRS